MSNGENMISEGGNLFVEEVNELVEVSKYHINCPECDSYDIFIEGNCFTCMNCGWSQCSL